MTTSRATSTTLGPRWNDKIVRLLTAAGAGHAVRASGASSLMIHEGKKLAAEIQLGDPIFVSIWITIRVGTETDSLDDPALHEAGEAALEEACPMWDARGFTRSDDEYVDLLNPDDPTVVFVARLDAEVNGFDEAVELVGWALGQKREVGG